MHRVSALIVSDCERLADIIAVVRNLLLCLGEGIGHEVDRLHGADREREVVLRDFVRV